MDDVHPYRQIFKVHFDDQTSLKSTPFDELMAGRRGNEIVRHTPYLSKSNKGKVQEELDRDAPASDQPGTYIR